MSELKKEFKNYMEDLEKNIQNKQDIEYVKGRTTEFMNVIIDKMEYILNFKEEKISQIEKIQSDLEQRISSMQQEIADIEQDIYIEDEEEIYDNIDDEQGDYDFEIVCPYCDNEFLIDLNQENSEIECPQCNNIIELDWSGNSEEAENIKNTDCGKSNCSGCKGCGNLEDEDDDM